jgi:hypothetical protein
MQLKNKSYYIIILLFLFFLPQSKAQVQILEKNVLEKIQNGHTHVIVNELHFPQSDEFLEVFKKYWTVTKGVDFVASDNVIGNMVEGDTYFSLEALKITGGNGGTAMFVYINLWQPTPKMLKDKKFKIGHEDALAHIQLSIDVDAAKDIFIHNKDLDFNFDGDGHFYHWNPGLLKNYLQLLCVQLKTDKKTDFHDDVTDKTQMKNLSATILYCPEDNLNKMGMLVKAGKKVDIKDVFEDYKYSYKSISDKELGEKILTDSEVFYYILFVRNSTSKLIAVVNSRTGEIIYQRYDKSMSIQNLKSGDLKDLYKTINKN